MAMTLTSRKEFYKLREIAHFLLVGKVCVFCSKPLSPTAEQFTTHGNTIGPKFTDKLTVHHIDGDHSNNAHENKALCHTSCHKSHHRREANVARAAAGAKP